ncbi:hypothetical protein ACVOMT_14430 [Sphingomonas panni]
MAPTFVRTPPPWFRIVAILFLLWGVAGVFAFYSQVTLGPAALAAMGEADRRFHASLPHWFAWVYGIATWGGLFGSIALLLGRRWAGGCSPRRCWRSRSSSAGSSPRPIWSRERARRRPCRSRW